MMLHTVSGTEIDIEMINADDAVLLWQNGVTLGIKNHAILEAIIAKSPHCYILNSDLAARGLTRLVDKRVTIIDMQYVVKLTEQYYPQLKW